MFVVGYNKSSIGREGESEAMRQLVSSTILS